MSNLKLTCMTFKGYTEERQANLNFLSLNHNITLIHWYKTKKIIGISTR